MSSRVTASMQPPLNDHIHKASCTWQRWKSFVWNEKSLMLWVITCARVCARVHESVCVFVCVRAADNEEIISTLFLFLFSPLSPAPLPPLPDILHCFSYYFAFVSEHLFLAPLPPACFAREGEKEGNKKKQSERVSARENENRSFLWMLVLLVVCCSSLIHSSILPLLFKGRL